MDKINSLPVLLRNPKILLIGGGAVALQKAKVLRENNIEFFVIAISFSQEFNMVNEKYSLKSFTAEDAVGYNIIIDATGNAEVHDVLQRLKEKRFFLLNTVDVPEQCDFYFSSLLRYSNLKIAISSDGASPTLTQVVREKIQSVLPDSLAEYAEAKLLKRNTEKVDVEETKNEIRKLFGKVYLIGCGPGDPELLTRKAYRLIFDADVVLYDNLVSPEILELIPEHIEKISVGKSKGKHSIEQESINNLLLDHARRGRRVARLKNGDPYIFGRGAEEALFLLQHGIPVEVVAGLSSALTAPLASGIPPTLRGISTGVTITTAHLDGCVFNSEWVKFLLIEKHTTIVLMGLTQVRNILEQARSIGVPEDLPVAIISNASKKNQKVRTSVLSNLIEIASESEIPAVLVFGEVVKYHALLSNIGNNLQIAQVNYPQSRDSH